MRHQRLLKKVLITIKLLKSIAERVKSKNERIAEIKKEKKNIENELFKYYFIDYQKPSDMYKKLCETKDKINEDQVDLIKKILDKIKKQIKNTPKNKKVLIKLNKEIINIVERIPYFNQLDQSEKRFKFLTPDQMLNR